MSSEIQNIITFRPVEADDEQALVTIFNESKSIKEAHGDDAWGHREFTPEEVRALMSQGSMYVGESDGRPVVTVTFSEDDERVWGERGLDGRAVYVHKLARLNDYPGVGREAMKFAETYALWLGKSALRLDNPEILNDYYESMGFEVVDSQDMGVYKPVLREKILK